MDWLKVLAAALFLGIAYHMLRPKPPLRIVVRRGRVAVAGPPWEKRSADIADFFRNDLPDVTSARVEGFWESKRVRLRVRGPLSAGQRQRIRNFLLNLR